MKSINGQRGGFYNLMFILAVLGSGVMLTLTVLPIYLDEAKTTKIVSQVASSPQYSRLTLPQLRSTLQKRWDVDDVKNLKVKEVKQTKVKGVKSLSYKYEVRRNLFANWDLVISFEKSFPMASSG